MEDMDTVYSIIQKVFLLFPELKPHWCDDQGNFHAHLFIILNKSDISSMDQGLQTPVQDSDVIDFLPPVGGGTQ